jgi:membrane associated rhomboid family serine protease
MTEVTETVFAIAFVLTFGGILGGIFCILLGEDIGVSAGAIFSGIEVGLYYLYLKIEKSRQIRSGQVL